MAPAKTAHAATRGEHRGDAGEEHDGEHLVLPRVELGVRLVAQKGEHGGRRLEHDDEPDPPLAAEFARTRIAPWFGGRRHGSQPSRISR